MVHLVKTLRPDRFNQVEPLMFSQTDLVEDLTTLNHIVETLNRAVDVRGALNSALARLVELMGLEAGWIFVRDPAAQDHGEDAGYVLAADYNLPPRAG